MIKSSGEWSSGNWSNLKLNVGLLKPLELGPMRNHRKCLQWSTRDHLGCCGGAMDTCRKLEAGCGGMGKGVVGVTWPGCLAAGGETIQVQY